MLSLSQINHFYELFLPLLKFTNQKTRTLPKAIIEEMLKFSDPAAENALRNSLWNNAWILDEFIQKNPAKLNPADLEIVTSWRDFRYGDFTILRVVRGMGIFLSHDEPVEFFSVNPLFSTFETLFPEFPIIVRTAILPFEDVIIYDGSVASYAVRFGSGLRDLAKYWYIDAKERNLIRTSFLPEKPLTSKERMIQIEKTNKSVLRYFSSYLKNEGHSEKVIERDLRTVQEFSDYLKHNQNSIFSLREFTKKTFDDYICKVEMHINKPMIIGLRRFFEFLRDTERMNWELATDILDRLKDLYDGMNR